MSFEQILLTIAITMATTLLVILIAGLVLLLFIVRKVKAVALRPGHRLNDAGVRAALTQVEKLAWLMDSSIPIGAGYRIGLDGLIDFVPGLGDLAGVLISAWIIYRAAACGAPQWLLMRMAGNVAIDALLGAMPVLGVVADSAFKANERNVALFRDYVNTQFRNTTSAPRVVEGQAARR